MLHEHEQIQEIIQLNKEMWPDRTKFDQVTVDRLIAQIVEELGEVHGATRSYFGRRYSPEKAASIVDVSTELGDLLAVVLTLHSITGEHLEDSLRYAINKLKRRRDKVNAQQDKIS